MIYGWWCRLSYGDEYLATDNDFSGNADGEFRYLKQVGLRELKFILEWDDGNDLDAHCIEPGGNRIHYKNETNTNTTGNLDIDIVDPVTNLTSKEIISWTDKAKMDIGIYKFQVHNYKHRGGVSGFKASIVFGGKAYVFNYTDNVPFDVYINVADVTLSNEGVYTLIPNIPFEVVPFEDILQKTIIKIPTVIKGVIITSCENMFRETNLEKVISTNENITNMRYMFASANSEHLDLSDLNTTNVTDMRYMFYDCSVASINLSSFNTTNVTDMKSMFSYCTTANLDLSNFNTTNVTDMYSMFSDCEVKNLNLSSFNTTNVTDMANMFLRHGCEVLDLSSFDTINNRYFYSMFYDALSKTGYAKTQTDADKFNNSSNKPPDLWFVVKISTFAKHNGVWKTSKQTFAKQGGVWKLSKSLHAKNNNKWR